MRTTTLATLLCTVALVSCSPPQRDAANSLEGPENGYVAAEAVMAPAEMAREPAMMATAIDIEEPQASSTGNGANPVASNAHEQMPVGMPQIAYRYEYGFQIDANNLAAIQRHHADLCVSKGPDVCRIISMHQSGSWGEYGSGQLEIEVVANQARDFGTELATAVSEAGGKQVASSISGEDLSKRIVDTEARLRARTLLRDRLMEVLRNRQGTVAELVEAERGVAQVNEEIDQASSWLAEMRGRVAFSDIQIAYDAGAPSTGGFSEPVGSAFGSFGTAFGQTIAAIIMLVAWFLPWLLLLVAGTSLWRRLGRKWWRSWKEQAEATDAEASESQETA